MARRKYAGILLAALGCCGCHMCSNCSDYAPPVIDGPYSHVNGRAGSIFSSGYQAGMRENATAIPEADIVSPWSEEQAPQSRPENSPETAEQ